MAQNDEIQIRALPRGNERGPADERTAGSARKPKGPAPKSSRRLIIYIGSAMLVGILISPLRYLRPHLAMTSGTVHAVQPRGSNSAHGASTSRDVSSFGTRVNASVNRHLQESEMKSAILRQAREMENSQFENASQEPNEDDIKKLHDEAIYQGPVESDTASQRVYEDLNDSDRATPANGASPADKINARLANRKWMSEQERAEKIEFIRSFVRSAYDKGYEVQIDSNLVVIGIRPLKKNKLVDINQVIDRLAKQGY